MPLYLLLPAVVQPGDGRVQRNTVPVNRDQSRSVAAHDDNVDLELFFPPKPTDDFTDRLNPQVRIYLRGDRPAPGHRCQRLEGLGDRVPPIVEQSSLDD